LFLILKMVRVPVTDKASENGKRPWSEASRVHLSAFWACIIGNRFEITFSWAIFQTWENFLTKTREIPGCHSG
jgi:hypothetical protein